MTHSMHQRISIAVLGVMLCLSGCTLKSTPTPTIPAATPTVAATLTATPTATAPPPTATPTPLPSPTPILGLALSVDGLSAMLATIPEGPLDWELISEVGALRRLEAISPAGGLTLVATARGAELLCIEARFDTPIVDEAAVEATFLALVDAVLPQWNERTVWLEQALSAAAAGEPGFSADATSQVRATLLQTASVDGSLVLVLSALRCNDTLAAGELEPFDPTLGLGFGRQTLQWAFEGLPAERRLSFTRSVDRMAQPVVVGTSGDSLATLTLVGPEEQLVFVNLSLAAPVGSAQAEADAVTLSQLLIHTALPNWPDGEQWMATAVRNALQGATFEQRRSGIRLQVQQNPASDRLVDISLAAIRQALPPIATPTPTPVSTVSTMVSIAGLPPDELACVTVVFFRADEVVERLPAPTEGELLGPEADEVMLEGDPTGDCPWRRYWTPTSRLSVTEGRAEFVFSPVQN